MEYTLPILSPDGFEFTTATVVTMPQYTTDPVGCRYNRDTCPPETDHCKECNKLTTESGYACKNCPFDY